MSSPNLRPVNKELFSERVEYLSQLTGFFPLEVNVGDLTHVYWTTESGVTLLHNVNMSDLISALFFF